LADYLNWRNNANRNKQSYPNPHTRTLSIEHIIIPNCKNIMEDTKEDLKENMSLKYQRGLEVFGTKEHSKYHGYSREMDVLISTNLKTNMLGIVNESSNLKHITASALFKK